MDISPEPFLLQAEQPQLSQPLFVADMFHSFDNFLSLLWTHSNSPYLSCMWI